MSRTSFRPQLEALEHRLALSTTVPASNVGWSDASGTWCYTINQASPYPNQGTAQPVNLATSPAIVAARASTAINGGTSTSV
jgi:hypothetical protein